MTREESKRTYQPPSLIEWGTIIDLTATGATNTGDDFFGGSVGGPCHPPGQTDHLPECQ